MTELPREVRRVLNARASDAITAIRDAIAREDREALGRAAWEFVWVLEEEAAAKREASA